MSSNSRERPIPTLGTENTPRHHDIPAERGPAPPPSSPCLVVGDYPLLVSEEVTVIRERRVVVMAKHRTAATTDPTPKRKTRRKWRIEPSLLGHRGCPCSSGAQQQQQQQQQQNKRSLTAVDQARQDQLRRGSPPHPIRRQATPSTTRVMASVAQQISMLLLYTARLRT